MAEDVPSTSEFAAREREIVSTPLEGAIGRALQQLPDALLWAMARGLRAHAEDLSAGVLFRGSSAGGCAVGITLRELAPDAFQFGWLRFWLWQRWRRGVERDVARRYPGLGQLQWCFDEAVAELTEAGRDPRPAKAVGLWLAASAQAEVIARRRVTHQAGRAHRRAERPRRGREHAEVGPWS